MPVFQHSKQHKCAFPDIIEQPRLRWEGNVSIFGGDAAEMRKQLSSDAL